MKFDSRDIGIAKRFQDVFGTLSPFALTMKRTCYSHNSQCLKHNWTRHFLPIRKNLQKKA